MFFFWGGEGGEEEEGRESVLFVFSLLFLKPILRRH